MKFKIFTKLSQFIRKRGTGSQQSENAAESANAPTNTEEFERCIMCGKLTCVPISMPIDWRENYEIGMGQICAECAKKASGSIKKT